MVHFIDIVKHLPLCVRVISQPPPTLKLVILLVTEAEAALAADPQERLSSPVLLLVRGAFLPTYAHNGHLRRRHNPRDRVGEGHP